MTIYALSSGPGKFTYPNGEVVIAKFKNGKANKVISRDTSVKDKADKKKN